MDMAGQLPEDVLLDVLRRLPARSLAVSHSVCKDWRTTVDAALLPLSLDGVFLQLHDPDLPFQPTQDLMPVLFSRRLTQRKIPAGMRYHPEAPSVYEWGSASLRVPVGTVDFDQVPTGFSDEVPWREGGIREGEATGMEDCCNGLVLLPCHVFNPATMEWVCLPPQPPLCVEAAYFKCMDSRYLVFDPVVSLHYEVLSVPCTPWDQLTTRHISKDVCTDKPVSAAEWPPTPYVMHVFSSRTMEWKERLFGREGKAAGTVADCQSKERYICHYAAYWHRALYVPCEDDFV